MLKAWLGGSRWGYEVCSGLCVREVRCDVGCRVKKTNLKNSWSFPTWLLKSKY